MTINITVQHNGGFSPDIILLSLFYYHRGTRLNASLSSILSISHMPTTTYRRKAHINWSMVISTKAATVIGNTLRTTGPAPAGSRQ